MPLPPTTNRLDPSLLAAFSPTEKLALTIPQHDGHLQAEVTQLMEGKHPQLPGVQLSQAQIGKSCGYPSGSAIISPYLKGKYAGNVATLEARLRDFLKSLKAQHSPNGQAAVEPEAEEALPAGSLPSTFIAKRMNHGLKIASTMATMAAMVGPPGLGKTTTLRQWCKLHPLAVLLTLNAVRHPGSKRGLVSAFLHSSNVDLRVGRKRGQDLSSHISDHFKGHTGRMIMVDNAHTLTRAGLDWLASFYEETGCPIVLIGNEELGDLLADGRRHGDRAPTHVTFVSKCDFDTDRQRNDFFATWADHYLATEWAEEEDTVRPLFETLFTKFKNLRSLVKISQFAKYLLNDKAAKTAEEALRMAEARQA